MDACFVLADCRQPLLEVFQHRGLTLEADVVGCFFALHYFFSTENDARSILQNVKDLLKPDGVFIGTLVDGELLLEKLRQHDGVYHHKIGNSTPLFTVCPVNFELDNPPVFGAHIDVELASSILEQYETSNGSKQENLVNFNALVDLASEYDLELIQTETFNQFFPDFPDITLSPEMAAYSSIHRSFRFRKISRSKLGPVQGVIQNIQRLEHQQLESRTVNDDRGATRAADMAYHVSSIVGKLDVKQTDHQADDQPPVQPSPPKRVSFQESKVIVKLKKPKLEPMKEEPKSLAKEPMQEEPIKEEPMKEEPIKEEPVTRAKRSRTVKKEEPIKDEPITDEPVKDEPKVGCGARCRLGNCKACVCRRKNQSKCDDDCGCSPHTCTNR
jgi:SAM-dependent methyltransferase